jgi:hypothetical protein
MAAAATLLALYPDGKYRDRAETVSCAGCG